MEVRVKAILMVVLFTIMSFQISSSPTETNFEIDDTTSSMETVEFANSSEHWTLYQNLTSNAGATDGVFSADGKTLISGSGGGVFRVWNTSTWMEVRNFSDFRHGLAISSDGSLLAASMYNRPCRVQTCTAVVAWNTTDWSEVFNYSTNNIGHVNSLKFRPNSSILTVGNTVYSHEGCCNNNRYEISQLNLDAHDNSAIIFASSVTDGPVIALAYSIDGSKFAYSHESEIVVDTASSEIMLVGHSEVVYSIAFSPNGTLLASGSEDNTVRIWNVSDGTLIQTIVAHEEKVLSVDFSPDGTQLVSGSLDDTARIWNTSDWSMVQELAFLSNTSSSSDVHTAKFSPDGTYLSLGGGNTIEIWSGDTDYDGIIDSEDKCPGTAQGFPADDNGCSASQRDTDDDGLVDSLDQCPGTEVGIEVDDVGCWWGQLDDDSDGIKNLDDCQTFHIGDSGECASGEWNYRGNLTISGVVSESGRYVAMLSANNTLVTYDVSTYYSIPKYHDMIIDDTLLDISNDGQRIIAGNKIIELSTGAYLNISTQISNLNLESRWRPSFVGNEFVVFHDAPGNVSLLDIISMESRVVSTNGYDKEVIGDSLLLYRTRNSPQEYATICIGKPYEFESLGIPNCENVEYTDDNSPILYIYEDYTGITLMEQGGRWGGGQYTTNGYRHFVPITGSIYGNSEVSFDIENKTGGSSGVDPPKLCGYWYDSQPIWMGSNYSISLDTYDSGPPSSRGLDFNSPPYQGVGYTNAYDLCQISVKSLVEEYTTTYLVISNGNLFIYEMNEWPIIPEQDEDNDGILDSIDSCPNTESNSIVNSIGCSSKQLDSDGDGVFDFQDNCPSTPDGTTVDSTGCAPDDVVDLDSDGDGVRDSVDTCPDSTTGIIVDSTGCETKGDVQELDDEVSSEDLSNAFIGLIWLLVVVGIIAAAVAGIKSLTSSSNDSYDWDYGSYSSVSSHTNPTSQSEPNLELQNVVAELERQRMQSEREMNQLRQQQAQQSSASEIAAMQREMQALQQRVADSEQAKLQLQNEIEQVKSQKDESINMQDSVVGGDMIASGGQKIESQTNVMGTDPEAIARIIFEAQEKERERMRKERNE